MPDSPYRLSVFARFRIWAAPLLLQFRDSLREIADDMPLLTRIASHTGLLLLMVFTIAASSVQFANQVGKSDPLDKMTDSSMTDADLVPEPMPNEGVGGSSIFVAPIPLTNAPKRLRRDVIKYTVEPGDTVSGIADEFEVSADSILWANAKLEDNPDMLSVGQILNIPPVTGVLYTVQSGDSVRKIADKFKTTKFPVDTLVKNMVEFEFNQTVHDLKPPDYQLTVGQPLMVPNGSKPYVPRVVSAYSGPLPATAARGTGHFGWPVSGRVTQKFWTRHPGIDIGAPTGAPVYAADSGYVVTAGWSTAGYGNMILINHGNGYVTRYGHLSAFIVETGDSVKKGQLIGRVGSTGNSTGPHLHFEIIQGVGHRNPFALLPGR